MEENIEKRVILEEEYYSYLTEMENCYERAGGTAQEALKFILDGLEIAVEGESQEKMTITAKKRDELVAELMEKYGYIHNYTLGGKVRAIVKHALNFLDIEVSEPSQCAKSSDSLSTRLEANSVLVKIERLVETGTEFLKQYPILSPDVHGPVVLNFKEALKAAKASGANLKDDEHDESE